MRARIKIVIAILTFSVLVPGPVFAVRLQPADLTYQGAFLVPTTTFFETWCDYLSTYRGCALSYRASGDGGNGTLLASFGTAMAELRLSNITPRMTTLQTATVLNSSAAMTSGGLSGVSTNDSTGGIKLVTARGNQTTDKLYFGAYEYYNVNVRDYNSLGIANLNFSAPGAQGLWHPGPYVVGSNEWSIAPKHGEYVFSVPQAWADVNLGGRSVFVGRTRESAGAGGAAGPVLTAIAPLNTTSLPPAPSALAATPLMTFDTNVAVPNSGTGWQKWRMGGDPDWDYYSVMDRVKDGEFVEAGNKRAVVLVMRHGTFNNQNPCTDANGGFGYNGGFCVNPAGTTPPWCYGSGYSVCSLAGPASDGSGFHAGPYKGRLVFIDPDDLAAVYAGSKQPDAVDGYAVYDLMSDWGAPSGTVEDRNGGNEPCGIAYNSTTGKMYVCQSNGNDPNGHPNPAWPVIHVYQVSGLSADTTPPTAPTGLGVE